LGLFTPSNLYAPPQYVVLTRTLRAGVEWQNPTREAPTIQDAASELRRIPLPRTSVNKGNNKGRGLLRRLPLPSPPEQIYPCTSTARTPRRTLHLPPTAPTIQPALATPETTRSLALSPSTQGRRSSAPSSSSWWAAWCAYPIPRPSQKKLCEAFLPVGR
jgi:hypothetical protein